MTRFGGFFVSGDKPLNTAVAGTVVEQAAPTAAELAQAEIDQQTAFDAVVNEGEKAAPAAGASAAGTEQKTDPANAAAAAPANKDVIDPAAAAAAAQSADALIAGMTPTELKESLARIGGLDARIGKEVDRVFSKIGTVERVVQDMEKRLKAGGGGMTARQLTAAMMKRVNEELPGMGDALAADLNEIFGSPAAAAELQQAQATAKAEGEKFDPEAYYAEKLAPALMAFEKKMTDARTSSMNEARQYARIDAKHEDWEDTIKSPEFMTFAYANGPTADERKQLLALSRSDPAKETAYQATLTQKYPAWWAERGHLIMSDKAAHAIKLLDDFVASKGAKPKPNAGQASRLAAAIPVKGAPNKDARQQGTMTDEEAMQAGFDAAQGDSS